MCAHTLFSHPPLTEYVVSEHSNKNKKVFCPVKPRLTSSNMAELNHMPSNKYPESIALHLPCLTFQLLCQDSTLREVLFQSLSTGRGGNIWRSLQEISGTANASIRIRARLFKLNQVCLTLKGFINPQPRLWHRQRKHFPSVFPVAPKGNIAALWCDTA